MQVQKDGSIILQPDPDDLHEAMLAINAALKDFGPSEKLYALTYMLIAAGFNNEARMSKESIHGLLDLLIDDAIEKGALAQAEWNEMVPAAEQKLS